ncbi:Hypothetical predicted protein [Olea europaea subsp. europaea]|uniref:DC1 domain-containing protein n=1 Tax=Olea europaea subsp. europaea TaxID=158383 RepID=A0A8S0SZJ7_OLEEU|nr:Hypothetical predicted protein [Olea europaea subsp. europaea]
MDMGRDLHASNVIFSSTSLALHRLQYYRTIPSTANTNSCSTLNQNKMHPCCAMLSTERNFPVHPHTLKLLPPLNTSSSSTDNRILCGECKKTRLGRVYLCTVCDYHLHAVCAKNLINGLALEYPSPGKADHDWKKGHATQVVFEAVGGLFEGLGQTIAEYFLQNIARGRGSTRSSEG